MDKLDTSQITAVIAIAAILSPILTAIINNAYHLVEKLLELKEQRRQMVADKKRQILEDYLRTIAPYLTTDSQTFKEKYRTAYALALLYVPKDTKEKMIEIDNLPFENRNLAKSKLETLIPELEKELKKL